MGDTGAVQALHLLPHLPEQFVGDLVGRSALKGLPCHQIHDQHRRAVGRHRDAVNVRNPDPGPLGRHPDERLMLHRLLQ